jgi:F0F1-type ATP synthase epsilon subunit
MPLTFEIVSPRGSDYYLDEVDRVVVRRREELYVPGSEIAIYPHHAPLLMQIQPCRIRISRGGGVLERDVPASVLEVQSDHVTVVLT